MSIDVFINIRSIYIRCNFGKYYKFFTGYLAGWFTWFNPTQAFFVFLIDLFPFQFLSALIIAKTFKNNYYQKCYFRNYEELNLV